MRKARSKEGIGLAGKGKPALPKRTPGHRRKGGEKTVEGERGPGRAQKLREGAKRPSQTQPQEGRCRGRGGK